MISNRELATFLLLGGGLLAAPLSHGIRQSLIAVLRSLVKPKILLPLVGYAAYLTLLVWEANRLGVWSDPLLGSTIAWFLFSGSVLFVRLTDAAKDEHFFRKTAAEAVGLGALFEFFVNLKSFPLWGELLLQPILLILVLLLAVAGTKEEYKPAQRLVQVLLGLATTWLLIVSLLDVAHNWHTASYRKGFWEELALPVWLTLAALPVIALRCILSMSCLLPPATRQGRP